jgi:hypothetical protein
VRARYLSRKPAVPWSGTVAGMDSVDGVSDTRMRAIAELALAVETGGGVDPAVQVAYLAGVEPYEIAELGGLPIRRVLENLGE